MKTIEKIDDFLVERNPMSSPSRKTKTKKSDGPISSSTLKWADKRRKDIETSVGDLKNALSSGDKNALGATLMTMKSLIQVIEQGLKLKEIPGRRLK